MSANSKQPAPTTINEWLASATHELTKAKIPTARLDAELILCHMLGVERAWLIAHGDDSLLRSALSQKGGVRRGGLREYGEQLLTRRLRREPLAYLFGRKEFYGRGFIVTKDVLVPRPETEALVELAKQHHLGGTVLDVGTGSGALGLTLWHELPDITLTASDLSPDALAVAAKNARALGVKPVTFVTSDLLDHWVDSGAVGSFDVIAANLPYVDKTWERSPETSHEPAMALFAAEGGLALIRQLIDQAPAVLSPGGHLLLEADPEQHAAIAAYANTAFSTIEQKEYALLLKLR